MKYIIIFDHFINGGCESLFTSIARRCVTINFDLIVLRNNVSATQIAQLPGNVQFVDSRVTKTLDRCRYFRYYINSNKDDVLAVIDFHEVLTSELFMFSLSKKINKWHWFNCNPLMKFKINKKSAKLYYFLFKHYNRVIFICNTQKIVLQNLVQSITEQKSFISYNFVDEKKVTSLAAGRITFDSKYILTVARIDYGAKDFETLVSAYELLNNDLKKIYKLVIVGDGPDRSKLEERISKSKDKEKIIMMGNQQNPYSWIKNAELFVLSSYSEGFPITILESFVLGTPVISSNCLCGPKEIFNEHEYGVLFEMGNKNQLAENIEKLLCNEDLRQYYSIMGKKRAEYYSKESDKTIKELFNVSAI